MAELPPSPHTGDGREPAPARPRWVTVFMVIAVALVLAFVILHLAGGGMGSHA